MFQFLKSLFGQSGSQPANTVTTSEVAVMQPVESIDPLILTERAALLGYLGENAGKDLR